MFTVEVSRAPIHGTVTRELDMNGHCDFQQNLVYSTASLLYLIISFTFKRMRMEEMLWYREWSWPHYPEAEIYRYTRIKPLLDNIYIF